MSENSVYVVVWSGQYKNDGLSRMEWIKSALHVKDVWLRGESGKWELLIDARVALGRRFDGPIFDQHKQSDRTLDRTPEEPGNDDLAGV